jgi:hypothetical protein
MLIEAVLLVSALLLVSAVYALMIYSNIIEIEIVEKAPHLYLTVEPTGSIPHYSNVTFIASLTEDGTPLSDKSITFLRTDSTGNAIFEGLGSNSTNSTGIATYVWNMTYPAGTYYFRASYEG